jgi:hypothetical protein
LRPVLGWFKIGGMLIAAASVVKAGRQSVAYWIETCFAERVSRRSFAPSAAFSKQLFRIDVT